jgi:hypothetical protein
VRSYNGHYLGLSIRRWEFDSPTHRQVIAEYGSGHPLGLISQESQVQILPLQPVLFQSSTAVVQLAVNQLVVGSIPASGAMVM